MAITGHLIELSENRLVFVGREGDSGDWYLAFRSAEGEDTKIRLSDEAMLAFDNAIQLRKANPGVQTFPHKFTWRLKPNQTEGTMLDSDIQ
jgi:hypothetical protein